MKFITDKKLSELPGLNNLSERERSQALVDAGDVYDIIDKNPFVNQDDLAVMASKKGITAERLSAAIEILKDSGRLFELPDVAVDPLTPQKPSVRV